MGARKEWEGKGPATWGLLEKSLTPSGCEPVPWLFIPPQMPDRLATLGPRSGLRAFPPEGSRGLRANRAEPESTPAVPPARPPRWARATRAVRVSRSRGPSSAAATCAESRGALGGAGPCAAGGRGTAPRVEPPGRAGGERPAGRCRGAPGPARQVAAPPRGRRAERNAPAAPARGRAAVGVASAPPSLPLAAARQDGPGPAGNWLRGPHICIRTGRGARARGRGGARGPRPLPKLGREPATVPQRGAQVTRWGSQAGGRGRTPPAARPRQLQGLGRPGWRGRRAGVRDGPSRRRAATAHRTLRCSGPTVRVTAADLFLGSATAPAPL